RDARRESSSCHAFPVALCEPAVGDDALQSQHRRVGGEDDELAARRRQRKTAVERTAEIRHYLDRALVEAGVREAQGELRGALAGDDDSVETVEERLEVDIPDPRHVAPVG